MFCVFGVLGHKFKYIIITINNTSNILGIVKGNTHIIFPTDVFSYPYPIMHKFDSIALKQISEDLRLELVLGHDEHW